MSTIKLSPAIKHLLTLRDPHPIPGPSLSRLLPVLKRTFQDAKSRRTETGWLVVTTCTLLTANRPSSIGHLYRFITSSDPAAHNAGAGTDRVRTEVQEAVNKAAIMRESALKATIFVGVPRVILSLTALHEALEDDVKSKLRTESFRTATPDNIQSILQRGQALWDELYDPHSAKLYAKLGSLHPDFIEFIIQSYGSVLAPLHESMGTGPILGNLSRTLGSVVGTACLRAEGRVVPQQISHVFGLLKARKTKSQSEEDAWLSSDEGTEWVMRTIDEILDVTDATATEEATEEEYGVKVKL